MKCQKWIQNTGRGYCYKYLIGKILHIHKDNFQEYKYTDSFCIPAFQIDWQDFLDEFLSLYFLSQHEQLFYSLNRYHWFQFLPPGKTLQKNIFCIILIKLCTIAKQQIYFSFKLRIFTRYLIHWKNITLRFPFHQIRIKHIETSDIPIYRFCSIY